MTDAARRANSAKVIRRAGFDAALRSFLSGRVPKLIEDSGIVDWRQRKHSGMLLEVHGYGLGIMETKLQLLPVDERIKLVEDLWDSIAADQSVLPLTADQKAELDSRLDAYAIDANRGQIATDAISTIRRRQLLRWDSSRANC